MIFQKCPKYNDQNTGEWYLEDFEILRAGIIAKYYLQVILLLVYNSSPEIFGNAQETFLFTVEKKKKTNTGVHVRNKLFTSMEEKIDSFFVKPVQTIQSKQHETVQ